MAILSFKTISKCLAVVAKSFGASLKEKDGLAIRRKATFSKTDTAKYQSTEDNLEYEVEIKVQVTVTPIFTTPKRDSMLCRHYIKGSDSCTEMGSKCGGKCFVDCLYYEPKSEKKNN